MRHKYGTAAVVLARTHIGEASSGVTLLTEDFGIVRARAQGLRKPGAKMAAALQTLMMAEVTLVKGKEGWRLTGAIKDEYFLHEIPFTKKRCIGRILELVQRLVRGEHHDREVYLHVRAFIEAIAGCTESEEDSAECLIALRILQILGHDAGSIPGSEYCFSTKTLEEVREHRVEIITRINHGIAISGL